MTQAARFVPVLELPDDWSGAITVVVREGHVLVLDEHPDDIAPRAARQVLGTLDGAACFAIDLDGEGHLEVLVEDLLDGLVPLMGLYGRVDDVRWTLAGRAVQLVEWDRTTRFCGRCGTQTEPAPGERARRCPACGLLAFPRLAPAVITLIERGAGPGNEALLARGRAFPVPMYSCIAGFVEAGETMEQAVHREVAEEVGVAIADVRYVASQPWPFPHSLMVGFEATWAGGDIVIDDAEIVDAQWFRRHALPMIPPGMSIARTLIDRWVARG